MNDIVKNHNWLLVVKLRTSLSNREIIGRSLNFDDKRREFSFSL